MSDLSQGRSELPVASGSTVYIQWLSEHSLSPGCSVPPVPSDDFSGSEESEHEVVHEMSEFLRSLLGRLRGYAGDRRNARRYVRLPLSLSPVDTHKRTNGRRALPSLEGYTKDISNNGLGIILPAIRIGEHYLVGEDRPLQIVLELPSGPIQMQATSTRYERLDEEGSEIGYLIGVQITRISDQHREALTAFIKKQTHT